MLITATGFGQTNVYHPFPDSNAVWNEINYYVGGGGCVPPNYCKYTNYLQGDTTLNSQLYHKIYSNDSTSISYVGGLRENNKKIYYFDKTCSHEILLYDFNLNIGDSILLPCSLCDTTNPMYMKVISIDSILLSDMTYRKKINFDYGPSWSCIEGIGSEAGLLYPYYSCIACICWLELVCFEQNDTTLYSNETHVPCFDYFVSNNDLKNNSNLLIVFPNPTADNLTIETPDKSTIEILNIQGQIIKTINTADKQTSIDVADLSSGVYIIKAKTERGVAVKKFIKE
jgi:hypothetical protein